MNIFLLDKDIRKCAQYHCDKHVVKMVLEYAQILCTVCNMHQIKTPYRSTHKNHPCVIWAGESIQNWCWLKKLALALNHEYKYRYQHKRDHKSATVVKKLLQPDLPNIGLTPFPQAMPEEFRNEKNPVQAYRCYYSQIKRPFATWTRRRKPDWWQPFCKKTPKSIPMYKTH
jgi:hypothetical protein